MARRSRPREHGFTLVEMLVALLVLAIALAALAPSFYSSMRASATTNVRSEADNLAVAANEQIRSIPYYEIGYLTTDTSYLSACQGGSNVTLAAGAAAPMDNPATFPTSETVGSTSFTLTRCVYWVNASDGSGGAYKQSVVTVSWASTGGTLSVSQTSALYPGGEGPYTTSDNNYPPGGTTTTVAGSLPPAPTDVAAVDDGAAPSSNIDVSWMPPSWASPLQYEIYYWTGGTDPPASGPESTPQPVNGSRDSSVAGELTYDIGGLSPNSTYYFEVQSIAEGVAPSSTSTSTVPNHPDCTDGTAPCAATQPATVTTSTTMPVCQISSINVNPAAAMVDGNGYLVGESSFAVTVNATQCNNVTVAYNPENGASAGQVVVSGSNGTLTGSVGTSTTVWTTTTWYFTVYVNGVQWAPLEQASATICAEKGRSGHC